MNEMVERVARAINEIANKQFNAYAVGKDESFELARAAIAAMREPNEIMLVEAMNQAKALRMLPGEAWRAMIDAALKQEA